MRAPTILLLSYFKGLICFQIFLRQFLLIFLNFISLPGNWIAAVLIIISAFFVPDGTYYFLYWVLFFTLLITGEAAEFYLQIQHGKKANASTASNIFGIIGAIAGGILFMPFLLGLGAIFGTLLGAFVGSFLSEKYISHKETEQAGKVACAIVMGKFLGMLLKFGLGIYLVFFTAKTLFAAL